MVLLIILLPQIIQGQKENIYIEQNKQKTSRSNSTKMKK